MEPVIASSPESVRAGIAIQKAQGKLKKLRKPARHRLSRAPERELTRALFDVVRRLGRLVETQVIPQIPSILAAAPEELKANQDARGNVRQDQFRERLTSVIRGVTVTAGTIIDIERTLLEAAQDVEGRNEDQNSRTMKAVVGVQPLISEPWLADLVEDFVARNASLITRVSQDYMAQVGETISRAVRSGFRAEQIEQELRKQYVDTEGEKDTDAQKLKRRMRLIARDQIASLNADITQTRQTQLGVKRFTWRTARDERVRGPQVTRGGQSIGGKYPKAKSPHTVLEGQVFEWSKGAPGGLFPGRPINCRCVAEPYLEDLVEGIPSLDEEPRADSLWSRLVLNGRRQLARGRRKVAHLRCRVGALLTQGKE